MIYFYITFQYQKGSQNGTAGTTAFSNEPDFFVGKAVNQIVENGKYDSVVITSWKTISKPVYEDYMERFPNKKWQPQDQGLNVNNM